MISIIIFKVRRLLEKLTLPLVAVLLLTIIISLPSLFTFNEYKNRIADQFTKQTGFEIHIEGDIGFKLIPYPTITLTQANITKEGQKKISANIVKIFPSLLKLLQGNIEPVKVSFYNAKITINNFSNYITASTVIPSIQFNNSSLVFEGSELIESVADLNATITHVKEITDQIRVQSNFTIGEQAWFLKANFININGEGDSDNATLSFGNNSFAIDFDGKVTQFFTNPGLDGALKLNLNALANQQTDTLLNTILQNESINLEGKLLFNPQIFKISDLKLSSKNIKNGAGKLDFIIKEEDELNAKFSIEEINLGEIMQATNISSTSAGDVFKDVAKFILDSFNFNLPNVLIGDVSFTVNKLIYENDAFEDFVCNVDIIGKEIIVDEISVKIPKNSNLTINGVIEHNNIRPKFTGNAHLVIEDLPYFAEWMHVIDKVKDLSLKRMEFKSQISFIPRSFRLSNIEASLDDTLFAGRGILKYMDDGSLSAKLITRLNVLDANSLKIPESIDKLIVKLFLYDADKSGEKFVTAIDDYRWLRRFPINLYLELLSDTIKYKSASFDKFHGTFRISPNNLAIDNIEIQSDELDFSGLFSMKLTAIKPLISSDFIFNKLNTAIIPSLFLPIRYLKQYQTDLYKTPDTAQKFGLPDLATVPDVNFFSLHNFDIDFKVKINELVDNTFVFNNIRINSILRDGVITFDDISGNVFNGSLKGIGNIVIIAPIPSFSFSYGVSNFDPSGFLKYFTGFDGITGYMSVNGNFNTAGNIYKNIFNKLYGTLKFEGKKIKVKAFDLGELIGITESNISLASKFDKLKYYSENGESLFDDLSGDAEIDAGIIYIKQAKFKNNRTSGIFVAAYDPQINTVNGKAQLSFIPLGNYLPITISTTNQGILTNQTFSMNTSKIAEFLTKQDDLLHKQRKYQDLLLQK